MNMFNIQEATIADICQLHEVIKEVGSVINNPDIYLYSRVIEPYVYFVMNGFTFKAEQDGKVVAVLFTTKGDFDQYNLFKGLDFTEDQISKSLIMENCAVLEDYRGNKLQKSLIAKAEEVAIANGFKYFICTVSPDNKYSLNNMLESGYTIVKEYTYIDGNAKRYLLVKTID